MWRDGPLRQLLRHAGVLLQGQIAETVFYMAALALVARVLGPQSFGQCVMIISYVAAIGYLGNLQAWQAVVHYGARAQESGDERQLATIIHLSYMAETATACLRVLVGIGFAPWVGQWLGWDAEMIRQAQYYAMALFFYGGEVGIGVLRLYDRFRTLACLYAGVALMRLIATGILLGVGGDKAAYLAVWAVAEMLQRGALGVLGWRCAPAAFSLSHLRHCLRELEGYRRFLLSTATVTAVRAGTRELDKMIVGAALGPVAQGFYHLAKQAGNAMNRLVEPLNQSIYPELSRMIARGEKGGFIQLLVRASCLSALAVGAIWAGFLLLGPWVIELVLGKDYLPAYGVMVWYLAGAALAGATFLLQPAIMSLGKPHYNAGVLAVTTLVYLAALAGLVRVGGVEAAGMAYGIFILSWALAMAWGVRHFLRRSA